MKFRKVRFSDVVVGDEGLLKGPFGSDLKKSLYVPKGPSTYKVYLQENILKQNLSKGGHYITKDYFENSMSRYEVKEGDFIVTCDGTLGEIFQLKGLTESGIISSSLLRITLNTNVIDQIYFPYLWRCRIKYPLIRSHENSVLKHLPGLNAIRNFEFEIPELLVQESISNVLSALDSKISLNNRINAELEAMAKTIYDYWFVQFDFPNERGKPYKSSGGKMVWNEELKREIPEGWDSLTLDQMGNIVGGSTPSREVNSYFTTDGIPWITPKDLSLNSGKKFIKKGEIDVTEHGRNSASLNKLPRGSVLMSSRAPVGYLAIARKEVTTNQGFKSFVPKGKFTTEYLYYTIKNLLPVIENNSSGSTFKEVSGAVLKTIYGIAPKDDIVESYTKKVYAIFNRQESLEEENHQLATLRDWLLPMLMNGQVTVKNEA